MYLNDIYLVLFLLATVYLQWFSQALQTNTVKATSSPCSMPLQLRVTLGTQG
jgi:hypothetical protein